MKNPPTRKMVIMTFLLAASILVNFVLLSSNSSLIRKNQHLGSNILQLNEINMGLLDKVGYRQGLGAQEIENCNMYKEAIEHAISLIPTKTGSGGVYDAKTNSFFISYAYARYTSWDIKYTGYYRLYVEKCF